VRSSGGDSSGDSSSAAGGAQWPEGLGLLLQKFGGGNAGAAAASRWPRPAVLVAALLLSQLGIGLLLLAAWATAALGRDAEAAVRRPLLQDARAAARVEVAYEKLAAAA
jgi:hypothetical protein